MRVILIAATTLCGRISPAPLGSALDRRFLEKMRDQTDASLMGSGTLRRDDPEMRGQSGVNPSRIRAFISHSGNISPEGKKVFQNVPAPILFTGQNNQHLVQLLAGKAEVVALPDGPGGLSLASAISELDKRGARSVLIEGGGVLNYHALHQQVVDEMMVTITPHLSGDSRETCLAEGQQGLGSPFLSLALLSCEKAESGEIFAHYQVQKKSQPARL